MKRVIVFTVERAREIKILIFTRVMHEEAVRQVIKSGRHEGKIRVGWRASG